MVAFALAAFFVLSLAVGYAPLVLPVQLSSSIGVWYFGLLSLATSVAVGLPAGFIYGFLFPRRTLSWALAVSVAVALAYLTCALFVRSGHIGHLWWTPFTDALFFVGVFTGVSCVSARARRVDTI